MAVSFSLPIADDVKKTCFFQISSAMAGGTFFDWGLNYLHGKSHNQVVDKYNHTVTVFPIPDSPIDQNQFAHGHEKNHPHKWHDIPTMLFKLGQKGFDSFTSFYVVVSNQVMVGRHNGAPMHILHKRNRESADDQWSMLSNWFNANPDLPHIFVYPDFDVGPMLWYRYQQFRYQAKSYRDYIKINDLTGFNFDGTVDYSDWDLRELIAVSSYNDFNWWSWVSQKQMEMKSHFPNAVHIPLSDIFNNQESVLKNLQNLFGWKFEEHRWDHWRNTYQTWRARHDYFDWFKNFNNIIDSIIESKDCFEDLDPIKEILIEHVLMRRGYSIKNYGLDRFPKNLKDLSLEPCLHSIPTI